MLTVYLIHIIIFIMYRLVFTKLPLGEEIILDKGSSSQLTCEMKAPSDSLVYWTHKKQDMSQACLIPGTSNGPPSDNATVCNTTAVVKETREAIDGTYSIFHLELQVR